MILRISAIQSHRATQLKNIQHQQIRTLSRLGDSNFSTAAPAHNHSTSSDYRSWQASQNIDIQRVTQTAMVHELTQQQTRSIEKVVPWFLNTMPAPYFRQVPESFRLDHIKAISAIKDANMDMHMNLKTHLPDGRQVSTHIVVWIGFTRSVLTVSFCVTFSRYLHSFDQVPCRVYFSV